MDHPKEGSDRIILRKDRIVLRNGPPHSSTAPLTRQQPASLGSGAPRNSGDRAHEHPAARTVTHKHTHTHTHTNGTALRPRGMPLGLGGGGVPTLTELVSCGARRGAVDGDGPLWTEPGLLTSQTRARAHPPAPPLRGRASRRRGRDGRRQASRGARPAAHKAAATNAAAQRRRAQRPAPPTRAAPARTAPRSGSRRGNVEATSWHRANEPPERTPSAPKRRPGDPEIVAFQA